MDTGIDIGTYNVQPYMATTADKWAMIVLPTGFIFGCVYLGKEHV